MTRLGIGAGGGDGDGDDHAVEYCAAVWLSIAGGGGAEREDGVMTKVGAGAAERETGFSYGVCMCGEKQCMCVCVWKENSCVCVWRSSV